MYHYTTVDGYKAIASQPDWTFKAAKPPGPHPFGAYFTPLPPTTPRLCTKLLIPRRKAEFVFEFADAGDLRPIAGDRGRHSFHSIDDYVVARAADRQVFAGRSDQHPSIAGGTAGGEL